MFDFTPEDWTWIVCATAFLVLMLAAPILVLGLKKPIAGFAAMFGAFIPVGILIWAKSLEGDTRDMVMTAIPIGVGGGLVLAVVSVALGAGLSSLTQAHK